MAVLMSTSAHAGTIGASMAVFDDKFGTLLRNGMEEYANTLESVDLQIEDAQNDVAKQQSQVQNLLPLGWMRSSCSRSILMRQP